MQHQDQGAVRRTDSPLRFRLICAVVAVFWHGGYRLMQATLNEYGTDHAHLACGVGDDDADVSYGDGAETLHFLLLLAWYGLLCL